MANFLGEFRNWLSSSSLEKKMDDKFSLIRDDIKGIREDIMDLRDDNRVIREGLHRIEVDHAERLTRLEARN